MSSRVKSIDDIASRSLPDPNSGCWIWTMYARKTKGNDYEQPWMTFNNKQYPAARISYMLSNEIYELDSKKHVLHKCHNCFCVNPNHLYVGDHAKNMQDMIDAKRGRGSHGRTPDNVVLNIKRALSNGITRKQTAELNGVSIRTVDRIKYGERHASVQED